MTEHRWSKFWWADWMRDPSLRSCSVAARGLWMDMLAIAFDGTPRGHVTIGRNPATPKQLATIAGITEKQCTALLAELEQSEVFSRTDAGAIFSRRMVRDTDASEAGREAISRRWVKPTKEAPDPNSPPNREAHSPPDSLESESEAEAETERKNTPPRGGVSRSRASRRGVRLPDGWQPADSAIAASLGLDEPFVLAKFRDHFAAMPGDRGQSANWDAAWRTWCRREADMKRTPYQPRQAAPVRTSQMSVGEQDAELMRLMRETARTEDETPPALRLVQ